MSNFIGISLMAIVGFIIGLGIGSLAELIAKRNDKE